MGRPPSNYLKLKSTAIRDESGRPLLLYHGTGNLASLDEFDPNLTGKGNDQLGPGFYFTDSQEEASSYAWIDPDDLSPRLGGSEAPGVFYAYIAIRNPLVITGITLDDGGVELTHHQATEILHRAPGIYDLDESPLGDFFDIWSAGKVTKSMVREAAQNYIGPQLRSIENDFYRHDSTAFRHALNDVLGFDGVTKTYQNGKRHVVAWFPEQILPAMPLRPVIERSIDTARETSLDHK